MKNPVFIFVILSACILFTCPANGTADEYIINFSHEKIPGNITNALPKNEAMTFVRNMGIGINIGNSLDAAGWNEWWHAGETGWGNPEITQNFVKALKNYGYKSIRLPVTWKDFMGPAPDYILGECNYYKGCDKNCPNRMERVQQVVNWILSEGMYCIINLHHDGDWIEGITANEAAVLDKFTKVWKQIAQKFSGIAQNKLIFESMNEVGFDNVWNQYGGTTGKDKAYSLMNKLNQAFVNTIRGTPGNENRFLLIAGYWTNISHSSDPLFKMPSDKTANRLILSVHYYEPSTFCIADKPDNSWGFRNSWGTTADYNYLINQFNKLRTTFLNKGIPVILGEYGVSLINKVEGNRVDWMAAVTQICLNYGICPMLWDTSGEISRSSPFTMRHSLKNVWNIINQGE
ncbi:MAG: glycoside hydrolase family 5 protein [Treponema sp.]|nr:glycoside hydrolase family 5 protein [Treponema sp.]